VVYGAVSGTPSELTREADLDSISDAFGKWRKNQDILLDTKIVDALKLDDFVFSDYLRGDDRLTLYIGYYHSDRKVGAAHDPLVCFPGQGWKLSKKTKQHLTVPLGGDETATLRYNAMLAEMPGHRELVVYWFQSYDQTADSTLLQKIQMLLSTIRNKGQDNAFVRINVVLNPGRGEEEALELANSFLLDFYPQFFNYIKRSPA